MLLGADPVPGQLHGEPGRPLLLRFSISIESPLAKAALLVLFTREADRSSVM